MKQTNWRQILSWKVSNEYSFDEMISMLQAGQVWKASWELSEAYVYFYVINPLITKRWTDEDGGQRVTIARGIWDNTPDHNFESGMEGAGISSELEPYTLIKQDFTQSKQTSLKFTPEELNVVYNGMQEVPGRKPMTVYTDKITGSSFVVSENETLEEALARVRKRFGIESTNLGV